MSDRPSTADAFGEPAPTLVDPLQDIKGVKRVARGMVLIEPEDLQSKTTIELLPEMKRARYNGRIIALGAPRLLDNGNELPHDFAVGDRVVFSMVMETFEVVVGGKRVLATDVENVMFSIDDAANLELEVNKGAEDEIRKAKRDMARARVPLALPR